MPSFWGPPHRLRLFTRLASFLRVHAAGFGTADSLARHNKRAAPDGDDLSRIRSTPTIAGAQLSRGQQMVRARRLGLAVATAVLLVGLVAANQSTQTQAPPLAGSRTYRATFTVTVTNSAAKLDTLEVYVARPVEWDTQRNVAIESTSPQPAQTYTDQSSGTGICYWKLQNVPKGVTPVLERFTFTAYDVSFDIDPGAIGEYDKNASLYKTNTRSEKFIEASDSSISSTARQVVGAETNAYRKAGLIYDWVIDHLRYQSIDGLGGAKFALTKGYGECGDYAALFCALLRAEGVPARPVVGYWAESGQPTHVWAEFYLPAYGWVPADPERGDDSREHNRDYYFAQLDSSRRLICSKGFNIKLSAQRTADLLQTYYWWYYGSGVSAQATYNLRIEEIG